MELTFTNLLIVVAIGFVAPLALGFVPSVRIPSVVIEVFGYRWIHWVMQATAIVVGLVAAVAAVATSLNHLLTRQAIALTRLQMRLPLTILQRLMRMRP